MKKSHFRVAIYGSARTKKDEMAYKLVYQLAKHLAKEGYDVVTGGGPGLMDAASRGYHDCKKPGHHSIGLAIKLPKEQRYAYHLDLKEDFNKFSKRLDKFNSISNVFVAAPGGVGTLLEILYTWQLMQVHHTCNVPLILLGSMWQGLISWMKKEMLKKKLVNKEDFDNIYIAKNCKEAMDIINQAHSSLGNKDFCLNYNKYKV